MSVASSLCRASDICGDALLFLFRILFFITFHVAHSMCYSRSQFQAIWLWPHINRFLRITSFAELKFDLFPANMFPSRFQHVVHSSVSIWARAHTTHTLVKKENFSLSARNRAAPFLSSFVIFSTFSFVHFIVSNCSNFSRSLFLLPIGFWCRFENITCRRFAADSKRISLLEPVEREQKKSVAVGSSNASPTFSEELFFAIFFYLDSRHFNRQTKNSAGKWCFTVGRLFEDKNWLKLIATLIQQFMSNFETVSGDV